MKYVHRITTSRVIGCLLASTELAKRNNRKLFLRNPAKLAALVVIAVGSCGIAGQAIAQNASVKVPKPTIQFKQPGAYFSSSASVDVGGLVATTHETANKELLEGNYDFKNNGATGSFINDDQFKAKLDDHIALMAPEVSIQEVIVAEHARLALAGGEHIQLDFGTGNKLQGITVASQDLEPHLKNKHAIITEDGLVILSAKAIAELRAKIIKNSSQTVASVGANTVSVEGGRISLHDGATGDAQVLGELVASAKPSDIRTVTDPQNTTGPSGSKETKDPQGAERSIAAQAIDLTSTAKLSVSGDSAGKNKLETQNSIVNGLGGPVPVGVDTTNATALTNANGEGVNSISSTAAEFTLNSGGYNHHMTSSSTIETVNGTNSITLGDFAKSATSDLTGRGVASADKFSTNIRVNSLLSKDALASYAYSFDGFLNAMQEEFAQGHHIYVVSNPDYEIGTYIVIDLHNYMRYGAANVTVSDIEPVDSGGSILARGVTYQEVANGGSVPNIRHFPSENDFGAGIKANIFSVVNTSDAVTPTYIGSIYASPAEIGNRHSLETALTILDGTLEPSGGMAIQAGLRPAVSSVSVGTGVGGKARLAYADFDDKGQYVVSRAWSFNSIGSLLHSIYPPQTFYSESKLPR